MSVVAAAAAATAIVRGVPIVHSIDSINQIKMEIRIRRMILMFRLARRFSAFKYTLSKGPMSE